MKQVKIAFAFLLPLMAQTQSIRVGAFPVEVRTFHNRSSGLPSDDVKRVNVDASGRVTALTSAGAFTLQAGKWVATSAKPDAPGGVRQGARSKGGRVAEARAEGLFLRTGSGPWQRVFPQLGPRSWAPADVRGVAFDSQDRLWFASPQGDWLEDAVDTLKRTPLDRIDWGLKNSHRIDIVTLPPHVREGSGRGVGYRVNGKVLPIDERYVGHWMISPASFGPPGSAGVLFDRMPGWTGEPKWNSLRRSVARTRQARRFLSWRRSTACIAG